MARADLVGEIEERIPEALYGFRFGDDSEWVELTSRAKSGLRDIIQAMRSLPDGSGGAVAANDVAEICRLRVDNNPTDETALWCLIAIELFFFCDTTFGDGEWAALHRLGRCTVEWPIYSAWYVFAESGADSASVLARLLNRLNLVDAARAVVPQFQDEMGSRWLQDALTLAEQLRG